MNDSDLGRDASREGEHEGGGADGEDLGAITEGVQGPPESGNTHGVGILAQEGRAWTFSRRR